MISQTSAIANGFEIATVSLRIFDAVGFPLQGFVLQVTDLPPQIIFDSCTPSDDDGLSVCSFRSSRSGDFPISFTDQVSTFIGQVSFVPIPERRSVFRISSSKLLQQEVGGYSVTTSLGHKSAVSTNASGYDVKLSSPPYRLKPYSN